MNAIAPWQHTVKDIWQMAQIIAEGRLFGVKSVNEAASLMLVAQAEGLHPAIAIRDYHIIQGKASMKADAMLARFQQAGGICQWECVTDAKVSALFSHPTKSPKPVLIEWTNETVAQAKISSEMHKKYPRQMKRARVISEGVRTVLPECVCGVYAPEEIATKAAELEELEREAAETIKPADATVKPAVTLPPVSPVNREIIVHFMGKGNPPKKKMLRDCTPEELAQAIECARDRWKRKGNTPRESNEAQADGELAKEWAAWRTTHPIEPAAPASEAPPAPETKLEDTGAATPLPSTDAAPQGAVNDPTAPASAEIKADVLTPTTLVFVKMVGKKPHKKMLKDMDAEEMELAYSAAQAGLNDPDRAVVARSKGVINLIDGHRASLK